MALEAMAAAVPVVASAHGAFIELVHDEVTGMLHRPRDAASLADCLRQVVADVDRNLRVSAMPAAAATKHTSRRLRVLPRWSLAMKPLSPALVSVSRCDRAVVHGPAEPHISDGWRAVRTLADPVRRGAARHRRRVRAPQRWLGRRERGARRQRRARAGSIDPRHAESQR